MFFGSHKSNIGRNDPCPCGSGLKYKRCCMNSRKGSDLADRYLRKHRIRLKTANDIAGIRKAGDLVVKTLDLVEQRIQPGMTTDDINTLVHDFTLEHNAIPAPLHYRGYPKSTCVSINNVICHGIPGPRKIEEGDIVNVDVTSILNGYYADANRTYFAGTPSDDARYIVDVARNSLLCGITAVRPGNRIGDIGHAIQVYAEGQGCSVVREFIGHGIGKSFHEPPDVPHYGRPNTGIELVPGMVFTIEPMINLGGKELRILDDDWTAVTIDGSLSAQFEQTVVVTPDGCDILTPYPLSG